MTNGLNSCGSLRRHVFPTLQATPASGLTHRIRALRPSALFSRGHKVDLLQFPSFNPEEGRHSDDLGSADEILRVGTESLHRGIELTTTHRLRYVESEPAFAVLLILCTELANNQCALPSEIPDYQSEQIPLSVLQESADNAFFLRRSPTKYRAHKVCPRPRPSSVVPTGRGCRPPAYRQSKSCASVRHYLSAARTSRPRTLCVPAMGRRPESLRPSERRPESRQPCRPRRLYSSVPGARAHRRR